MKKIIILTTLLCAASFAHAADWSERVSSMTQGQGKAEILFDGPDGVKGIVIGPAPGAADNKKVLAWGLPSGLMVIGNLYDRTGRNLNEVVRKDKPEWFVPAPVVDLGDDPLWGEAEGFLAAGRAVSDGKEGERVYAFLESTCGYCRRFYQEYKTNPVPGVNMVWVPVTRDGKNMRTGAILNGDMDILVNKNKSVRVTREQEDMVYDNALFLQERGGRLSTPAFLVKKPGEKAKFHYGLEVKELRALMAK
jgi:hypothetical protein